MSGQQIASKEKMHTLKDVLEKNKKNLKSIACSQVNPDRLIRIALSAASRSPYLLECTPVSIVKSLVVSAQLGLDPDGILGSAYLVPYFNNKNKTREAQLIIGYRGLIDLARRSGNIATIEAHTVYEGDKFKVMLGLNPILEHEPNLEADQDRKIKFCYAIAKFKDGSYQYEIMTKSEIDGIRSRSSSRDHGPWVTDFEQMARKTVIKRLAKYLPLTVELAKAVAIDNAGEAGESQIDALDADFEVLGDKKNDTEQVILSNSDRMADSLTSW